MLVKKLQRAELLCLLAQIIIDEASIKEQKLFALVDVIVKDLQGSGSTEHRPQFYALTAVLPNNNFQLPLFVPSHGWVKEQD